MCLVLMLREITCVFLILNKKSKMAWIGILIVSILSVASGARIYSTDKLEQFLIEALKDNETLDFYIGNSNEKPCTLYVPNKPNFTVRGQRISDTKCNEYIWELENGQKERERIERCQLYVFLQLKKGVIPEAEAFIAMNSPVIFGGRDATSGEFPHMGAMGWRAKDPSKKWLFKCGSSLISDKFLLTAAHCSKLPLRAASDIVHREPEIVRFGVKNIEDDEFNKNGEPLDMKIKRLLVHPLYKSPKKYYDICLIELEMPIAFSPKIHPACLWNQNSLINLGSKGKLAGWGFTEKGSLSNVLQVATVDFIETQRCDTMLIRYRNRNWPGFGEHQMCAGNLEGGVDTCQGDSGGPIQVQIPLELEDKIYRIVGITSFGVKCGKQNHPGVYTRVSSFIDWIEENVWGSNKTKQ